MPDEPKHEKILFVDDEPQVLEGIERLLYPDFHIDTATSGGEALAKLRDGGPYAVVVCDMRMPEMDGVQLLCKIKVKFPEAIRLMLTGNTDQPTAVRAVNEGNVFRFLTKPCEEDDLKRELNAALVQYRLAAFHEERLAKTADVLGHGPVVAQAGGADKLHPDLSQRLKELVPNKAKIRQATISGAVYTGEVIAVDSDYVVQALSSSSAVAHPRSLLDPIPSVGEVVRIAYDTGVATVVIHESKAQRNRNKASLPGTFES